MTRSLLTNETSELDLLDQRPFDQTDFDILKSYEAVKLARRSPTLHCVCCTT